MFLVKTYYQDGRAGGRILNDSALTVMDISNLVPWKKTSTNSSSQPVRIGLTALYFTLNSGISSGNLFVSINYTGTGAGIYQVSFNTNNLSSGTYIYVLEDDSTKLVKKMLLLK
jgi:hypothetical protein